MDLSTIGGALTSINAARDIAKTMIGLRDTELLQSKTIELNGVILQALGQAIEARQAEAAQIDEIRALKEEIARLKAWGTERENYEMKSPESGVIVYMLKPEKRAAEPPHWLCATCYGKGQKGFLQTQETESANQKVFGCGTCGAHVATHWGRHVNWID